MFENLQVFENRYEELNNKLYDPQTAADRALYAALMKEHKELSPIVEAYQAYLRCERDLQGARELLEEGGDRELREMAQQEIREKGAQLLGWELDDLLERTLQAMRACEGDIEAAVAAL